MKTFLDFKQVSHWYGKTEVLRDCSFSIAKGELVGLLGESGSGKTTALRLIAGFEKLKSGVISLNDQVLTSTRDFIVPEKRSIGMVFQDYALFPHLKVGENIAIGQPSSPTRSAADWLSLIGLSGMESRRPDQLSGGQQQRVAIARAMAARPAILLLDEPFSNIDESLKFGFRLELSKLLKQEGMTAIFVTHDTKDALAVADRIVVLKDGEIRQVGTPEDIYQRPNDTYVTGLLGPYNVLEKSNGQVKVLRAEHCRVNPSGELSGIVQHVMYQGGHYLVKVDTERGSLMSRSESLLSVNDSVNLNLDYSEIKTVIDR